MILKPTTTFVVVIAAWQAACAVAMALCGYAIGWVVHSVYTSLFGDVQESYATYERAATYTVIFTVTALATAVGVLLLRVLERRATTWRRTVGTFIAWHAAAVAALVASNEWDLPWIVHRLDREIFGTPESLYTWRNLVWPRVIAWVLSSTPAIAAVLWLRSKVALAPSTQAQSMAEVGHAQKRGLVITEENPYEAPQTSSTTTRVSSHRPVPRSRFAFGVLSLAIISNIGVLPLVVLIGFAGANADTSPRENALWGAVALAVGMAIVINLIALIYRRRLTGPVAGIVVAINAIVATLPVFWLATMSYGAWGAALSIWSFAALTAAALVLTARKRTE